MENFTFTFIHLSIALFVLFFLIICFIRRKQRRDDTIKDLTYNSITDAVTLNSGVVILLYTTGKFFTINYLTDHVDSYMLLIALTISGTVIISDSLDKLRIFSLPKKVDETLPCLPVTKAAEGKPFARKK